MTSALAERAPSRAALPVTRQPMPTSCNAARPMRGPHCIPDPNQVPPGHPGNLAVMRRRRGSISLYFSGRVLDIVAGCVAGVAASRSTAARQSWR
jgi:hypothetical protein